MKVVLANGCWDPFHYGHLLHLQYAKQMGDRLVVSVTRDVCVNKGPGRPVFDQYKRADILRSLRIVSSVILCDDALEALRIIQPNIFVKGEEYKGKIKKEHQEFCEVRGIEIKFTSGETYSSTKLLHYYAS